MKSFYLAAALWACHPQTPPQPPSDKEPPTSSSPASIKINYSKLCKEIASDIEALKGFPQLKDFKASTGITQEDCHISYTYHCHESTHRGGWSSAVPNPDEDGLWFYIGLWDETDPAEAGSQINTQPVMPRRKVGGRNVTFLILEGEKTTRVSEALLSILKKHGMKE